ncbi:hypothetical protein E2C01_043267 [Portunus trituberculatus]|uniref:Uncharacterized protein n=1 Tax=Portunus trituberculatus TaxID=210409 RepID=A0A5B7FVV3_PORTR|nr:hypothetical protein [Portunus trituberculatus]
METEFLNAVISLRSKGNRVEGAVRRRHDWRLLIVSQGHSTCLSGCSPREPSTYQPITIRSEAAVTKHFTSSPSHPVPTDLDLPSHFSLRH